MSLDSRFQRGFSAIAAAPSELRAVRNYQPLMSAIADTDANIYTSTMNTGTNRMATDAAMSQARSDMKAAKTDAMFALPVTVAGAGLSVLGAHERRQESEAERLRKREEADYWAALGEVISRNYKELYDMLKVPQGSAPAPVAAPIQTMTPIQRDPLFEGGGY